MLLRLLNVDGWQLAAITTALLFISRRHDTARILAERVEISAGSIPVDFEQDSLLGGSRYLLLVLALAVVSRHLVVKYLRR